MKYRATKNEIMNGFDHVIKIGYCDLQHLLNYRTANAYTCGRYGWNADIYEVAPSVAICTGYNSFGNVQPDYNLVRDFEKRAEAIRHEARHENAAAKLEELLAEFVRAVTGKEANA